ncbi:hypothetical protein HDU96_005057 [Phlyctochytrium bullatum]|nr:hypothetical protein HDU96_005057 [Phlyctochytrium bullatum]
MSSPSSPFLPSAPTPTPAHPVNAAQRSTVASESMTLSRSRPQMVPRTETPRAGVPDEFANSWREDRAFQEFLKEILSSSETLEAIARRAIHLGYPPHQVLPGLRQLRESTAPPTLEALLAHLGPPPSTFTPSQAAAAPVAGTERKVLARRLMATSIGASLATPAGASPGFAHFARKKKARQDTSDSDSDSDGDAADDADGEATLEDNEDGIFALDDADQPPLDGPAATPATPARAGRKMSAAGPPPVFPLGANPMLVVGDAGRNRTLDGVAERPLPSPPVSPMPGSSL